MKTICTVCGGEGHAARDMGSLGHVCPVNWARAHGGEAPTPRRVALLHAAEAELFDRADLCHAAANR